MASSCGCSGGLGAYGDRVGGKGFAPGTAWPAAEGHGKKWDRSWGPGLVTVAIPLGGRRVPGRSLFAVWMVAYGDKMPAGYDGGPLANAQRWGALLGVLRTHVLLGRRVFVAGSDDYAPGIRIATAYADDLDWLPAKAGISPHTGQAFGWRDVTEEIPLGLSASVPGLSGLGDGEDGGDDGGDGQAVGGGAAAAAAVAAAAGDEPAFVAPGAVPFRAEAWDLSAGTYELHEDDTLYGIGLAYLDDGSPSSLRKISALNQGTDGWHSLDSVDVGTRIRMPPEAVARARRMIAAANARGAVQGIENALVTVENWLTAPFRTGSPLVIAATVGAAALVVVGGVWLWRRRKARATPRTNPARRCR